MIEDALQSYNLVLVDDVTVVTNGRSVAAAAAYICWTRHLPLFSPKRARLNRKLVFAVEDEIPWPIRRRARIVEVHEGD